MLTNIYGDCICVIAPFPNNPNTAEDFDSTCDMNISCQGLMWYVRPQPELFWQMGSKFGV